MADQPETAAMPSRSVLLAAARLLIASERDDDFPVAEIMLRNILNARAASAVDRRLDRIGSSRR